MYRLATAVLFVALAAGCGSGGDNTPPPQATASTPITMTSVDPATASKKTDEERVHNEKVAARLREIEAKAAAQPALGERLVVFITEYCNLKGPAHDNSLYEAGGGEFERDVVKGLSSLYAKIWMAGTGWNTPLYAASQQQGPGTCPLPPRTPQPIPKG